jgi:hypothetical protein
MTDYLLNENTLNSAFHKFDVYTSNIVHPENFINESQRLNYYIGLSDEESLAFKYTLKTICEAYLYQLLEEDDMINEGFKDFTNKVKDLWKLSKDKVEGILKKASGKIKTVIEFIIKINKALVNSVEKAVEIFEEMLEKLNDSVRNIFRSFFGTDEKQENSFLEKITKMVQERIKEKSSDVKESFDDWLNNDFVFESEEGYVQKLAKEEENKNVSTKDIYQNAIDAKPSKKLSKWKTIGKAVAKAIGWGLLSYVLMVLGPALIGLTAVGTPLVVAIAHLIGCFIWGTIGVVKAIRNHKKYINSPEFEKKTKKQKLWHWFWFVLSLALAAAPFLTSGFSFIKTAIESGASSIMPPESVQNCIKFLNNIWKNCTGVDNANVAKNFPELLGKEREFVKIVEEHSSSSNSGQEPKELTDQIDKFKNGHYKGSTDIQKGLDACKGKFDTPGYHEVSVNMQAGATKQKDILQGIIDYAKQKFNVDVSYDTITNGGVSGATKNMAGHFNLLKIKTEDPEQIKDILAHATELMPKTHSIVDWTRSAASTITDVVSQTSIHIPQIMHTMFGLPFSTIIDVKKVTKKGPFLLVMNSSTYGENKYKYTITEAKYMTYKDASGKYKNLNENAFTNMQKMMDKQNKYMDAAIEKISKDESKDSDKLVKEIEKYKKNFDKNENIIVFYTTDKEIESNAPKEKTSKEDKKNEGFEIDNEDILIEDLDGSKYYIDENGEEYLIEFDNERSVFESKDDLIPVVLFNPYISCGVDLINSKRIRSHTTKKGERRLGTSKRVKPWTIKGLFKSLQFLPVDGGMSTSDIHNLLIEIGSVSITNTFRRTIPTQPCKLEDKKWIVDTNNCKNENEVLKDFGLFTPKEIADSLNDKENIYKLFGNTKQTSDPNEKNNFIEQNKNVESRKARYFKWCQEDENIKKEIQNDEWLKSQIGTNNEETNKKNFEIIYPRLVRIENEYYDAKDESDGEFTKKEKKSIWKRIANSITSLFKKKKEDKDIPKEKQEKISDEESKHKDAVVRLGLMLLKKENSRTSKKKNNIHESLVSYMKSNLVDKDIYEYWNEYCRMIAD